MTSTKTDEKDATPAKATTKASSTKTDTIPRRPDPGDLVTNRVYREGDPDFDALSNTGPDAQGNRFPQTFASADAEATEAENTVADLEAALEAATEHAAALRTKANNIKASEDA